MRRELGLHARRQQRHRHVLVLHVLQVAHNFGGTQTVQCSDHMSHIGFVFASYRALLDGLLNFTNAIFLIRHDGLLSFLRDLPAPKCIRPMFRKNDTDAPMLYF
jgi:hypothetical protein